MAYLFEEFKQKSGRFNPLITVAKSGGFGISTGFSKKYDIQGCIGVKLFYDRANSSVGLKFVKEKEAGMFKLKVRKDGGAHLPAKSFFEAYEIKPEALVGRYIPEKAEDNIFGTLFVITLRELETDKTKNQS